MTVYAFLHEGYSDWELGYILPELRTPPPAPTIEKTLKQVTSFGLTTNSVLSMGGLRVTPDVTLADVDLENLEALILPGGTFWNGFEDASLDALVAEVSKANRVIGAICAATGYLAGLGLLDDVDHTSNACAFLKQRAPNYQGQSRYKEELAVDGGNLVTASGLGAVDFAHKLLLKLKVYPPAFADVWLRAFKYGEDPFSKSDASESAS